MSAVFKVESPFEPSGDQPQAIKTLSQSIKDGNKDQVLLGVTGSGKTFTMAHVIQDVQKPTLIMAHNKTLAAQLYSEMKEFFPNNAVEYFVSYYDYYQPEAYVPRSDVYIEKDASINEQIDLLRHSATRSLLERRDVIVVASVSCIYGIGSPDLYFQMKIPLKIGDEIALSHFKQRLVELSYERNDVNFVRGTFRVRGDTIDVHPSHLENIAWRFIFFGDELEEIYSFDSLTGQKHEVHQEVTIYANSHYVTPRPTMLQAIDLIKDELKERLTFFDRVGKKLEEQRIEQRTMFDLEMMQESGTCKGVENYSRYLSGRNEGEPPPTLFEYFPDDALLIIDESHVTVPQIGAMFKGDRSRKSTLVDYGFRLPSAKDNRPLKFEEWEKMRGQTLFVSATPGVYELDQTQGEFAEQVIRPTGLVDPECIIRPVETQVDDLIAECQELAKKDMRVLVTTLTKKMAEDLTAYLKDVGLKVAYLHSDIQTLERVQIMQDLRRGTYDVLVGVNLLREGLDIPECGLVAILDADKEGFLRSETSLIQTIGRAARNAEGKVILYADKMTKALTKALAETDRRRNIQKEYNKKHGITPTTVKKAITDALGGEIEAAKKGKKQAQLSTMQTAPEDMSAKERKRYVEGLRKDMLNAASNLEFEKAASLRDELQRLENDDLGIAS